LLDLILMLNLPSCTTETVLSEEKLNPLSTSDPVLTNSVLQVLSIVLGMVLRTLGPDRETDYDSEDDTAVPARLPLLRNQSQHGSWDYAEATTSRQGLPLLHSKCVQR
jgi:hypothetical protein